MSYTTTIVCNQCEATAVVPQPGAVPAGWIVARAAFPQGDSPQNPNAQTYAFCGWRCAAMYCQIQDAQQSAPSATVLKPAARVVVRP